MAMKVVGEWFICPTCGEKLALPILDWCCTGGYWEPRECDPCSWGEEPLSKDCDCPLPEDLLTLEACCDYYETWVEQGESEILRPILEAMRHRYDDYNDFYLELRARLKESGAPERVYAYENACEHNGWIVWDEFDSLADLNVGITNLLGKVDA